MKRALRGAAITLATILAAVCGFELLARTVLRSPQMEPANLQPDAGRDFAQASMLEPFHEFGARYRGRPGARVTVYGVEYRHDDLGLRARETKAGDGALRVLVLGDSNTYGWRVPAEATFCAVAERLLDHAGSRPVEFVNAGLPGYNTADALARYRSLRDALRPDVVLLAWFVNDCERFGFEVDDAGFLYFDPFPLPTALRRACWRSYGYRWFTLRRTASLRAAGVLSTDDPEAFRFSMDRVVELAALVRADGGRFAVLDVPLLEPAAGEQRMRTATYREREKSTRLAALCSRHEIPYLEFLPAIDGEPVALLWGSIDPPDHHPNAKAHEKFGARLATFLSELGWLR